MSHRTITFAFVAIALACGSVVHGITKKSDEGSMQGNSQPVYSPPGGGAGSYAPMANQFGAGGSVPEHGSVQSNMQAGGGGGGAGGPQSNMYYYYYPVPDNKPKEQYHSAAPQGGHPSQAGPQDSSQMEAAASGSEISYSAQDMNQDYGQQGQNFDPQTLSNIASQLQSQYNFNQQPNNYENNAPGMQGYGHQGDASSHIATQVHPGFNQPMGHQGPISFQPQGAQFPVGQHPFGNFAQPNQGLQAQSSEVSGIASSFKKYGLSTILMPVLALAGLSLLLPTVTSLGTTTTKTKRSIEESAIASYVDKMDNYYKLYNKAMEKEECMNRMICELG